MKRLPALVLVAALCTLVWSVAGCSEVSDSELRGTTQEGASGNSGSTTGVSATTGTTTTSTTGTSGSSSAAGAPVPPSASEARQLLGKLGVSPAGSMAGYSREEFPHWASDGMEFGWQEPDGSCDVRDDALIRDGHGVEIDEDCSFTAGEWLGPYTGATLPDPSDIDIDHVVPLANAWRSEADEWSTAEREAYANDPSVLLSTDDGANQEKGDKGPEAWRPPNASYHCEYARRWIDIKSEWEMTVNADEKAALREMLDTCGGE